MAAEIQPRVPRRGLWGRAADLAARTPETRNRYVDFLRALSIGAVVVGHWLMAAPHFVGGEPRMGHMLDIAPWTHWLTWLMQVMPVFFFVGGFSNGTSWDAAQRRGTGYSAWLEARLRRLVGPVLPLLVVWAVIVAVAHARGVSAAMIRVGSRTALVPVWFLAVYLGVVLLVPLTRAAWNRVGMTSFWALVAAAVAVDLAVFAGGQRWAGWLNYLFIWVAVHQLGYAWQAGRLSGPRRALPWLAVSLPLLWALTRFGPYPLSLVGVPGEELSNTLPPKLPLLALAGSQIGLLLAVERPLQRLLARAAAWTATVLVNGMIMTLFLWHSTVMVLLIGLGFWVLPSVHADDPGSGAWWLARVPWLVVYAAVCLPFLVVFSRFERAAPRQGPPPATWRLLTGCAVASTGLAMLALGGVGGDGWLGLRVVPLVLPVVGASLGGFWPLGRRRLPAGAA